MIAAPTEAAAPAAAPAPAAPVEAKTVTSIPIPVFTPIEPQHMALPHRPSGLARRPFLPPHRWAGTTARCSLHWAGWLAVVPFAAVTLFTATASARARGMGPGGAVWHVLSTATCGLAAALLVAWLAWRVRGRTRTSATVAFVAALCLISIADAAGAASRSASQAAAIKSTWAKAAGEATQAGRRADASIDHAFDCLQVDGGLSLRGVTATAQIDRRLGLFDDVLRAVRQGREEREAVQARLQLDLVSAGIPAHQRAEVFARFQADVQWDADHRIIDATERVLIAGRNELRFIRQEWGRMRVDRDTGVCYFQDKKAAERLKRLATEVVVANGALREAVKEGVAQLKGGAAAAKPHELTPTSQAAN